MRPASIVQFERLYLAAIAAGLLNAILSWSENLAEVRAQAGVGLGEEVMLGVLIAGVLLQLLLWYLIARGASVVAKWIFVVLFVIQVVSVIAGLAMGGLNARAMPSFAVLLGLAATLLEAGAAWMLFRPDAKEWLASGGRGGGKVFE